MRSRGLRTALAALLVVFMVIPTAAFASKSEVDKLKEELAEIKKHADEAGAAYSEAQDALELTQIEIDKVDEQIVVANNELAAAKERLAERCNHMYRTGGIDYLAMFLGSDSIDDALTRFEYVSRLAAEDAAAIDDVRILQDELAAKRERLEELRVQQEENEELLAKRDAELRDELAKIQKEYTAKLAQLKAAEEAARRSSGYSSANATGMVFPVRGAYYYRDTWGAPRSGGRTHKGTDIMASTGTPCVAVMSGTVQAKSNSLGGLTIWLTADNGWKFYYAHLSRYVRTSGRVTQGEVIGYVGSSGNASASAPHLHFQIHPNGGAAVNPYPYLRKMEGY